MDGPTLHARFRTMLHDTGEAYVTPNPEWSPGELTLRLQEARDVVYTMLVDEGCVVSTNRLVKTCPAADGTLTPVDYWRGIIGTVGDFTLPPSSANTGHYVLFQPIDISIALGPNAIVSDPRLILDTIYVTGSAGDATHRGTFHGTADTAFYYAQPADDLSPTGATFADFSDGVYDAVMMLAAIEITQGETQDAADRIDDLNEIWSEMMQTFE